MTAGWYRDPTGRYASRYWDGQRWSDYVNSGGANGIDPLPDEQRAVPPAPGTETVAAAQTSGATVHVTQQTTRSVVGTIVGVLLTLVAVIVALTIFLTLGIDEEGDAPATTNPPATTAPASTEAPADG